MAPQLTHLAPKLIGAFFLLGLACLGQPASGGDAVDRTRITALSKTVLRDSAELPMDVTVTTVITDSGGNAKRRSQSSVHFLFHGYNQNSGRFSFDSRSGWFNTGALRDSFSGDLAVYEAFSRLAPAKDTERQLEIRQEGPGEGFAIQSSPRDCHVFEMQERALYPKQYCSSVEFHTGTDATGGLTLDRFTLDIGNLPAPAKIAYLGAVQIRRIRAEGDIQKAYVPKDPQPFFIPKRVVTTIGTDKGNIVLTNEYTLTTDRARKK